MKIAVIGAGPAGITAAYSLVKGGAQVDVYEASNHVGGMARSFELWGQTVDLGPHRFFSQDRRVNELWLEVAGSDYAMVKRKTRVLYKNKFFDYPLNPIDVLPRLGLFETLRCSTSYVANALFSSGREDSFEDWIVSRFGKRLYEIFFKSYSEKLWGIKGTELDADFAAQRIRQFSLKEALKGALTVSKNSKHRTLVDTFAYPLEGAGMIYRRMAQTIEASGSRILFDARIKRAVTRDGKVIGIERVEGGFVEYDVVISSMPLTTLVRGLDEAPLQIRDLADQLQFRNTILVYLEVACDSICEDNWIYVQEPGLATGRITNFRNWIPELYGDATSTILAFEYWCNDQEPIWRQSDDETIDLAVRDLRGSQLVGDDREVLNGRVIRVPKCYPVYRRGYRDLLVPIQDYLTTIDGLHIIGRYGAFKYNNQDHSILMGLLTAEKILTGRPIDLWAVNCDYDTYQEKCEITETGLVTKS